MKENIVDIYIANQPEAVRERLEQIRSIIKAVIPATAEETISYQVPSYKYHGMLVGFGVHKGGCSFYTMNLSTVPAFSKELKEIKSSGSTIHFTLEKPLPVALIKKITQFRVKENEAKAKLKKQLSQKNKK